MSTPQHRLQGEEADSFTGGPGVVATKSQARGALGGMFPAAAVGALIGLIVGALFFNSTIGIVIAVIAFAVAGLVFGAVSGGIANSAPKSRREAADV